VAPLPETPGNVVEEVEMIEKSQKTPASEKEIKEQLGLTMKIKKEEDKAAA
jgi:hypothetical protein